MTRYNFCCEYRETDEHGISLKGIRVNHEINMKDVEKSAVLELFQKIAEDFYSALANEREHALCEERFQRLNDEADWGGFNDDEF